CDDQRLDGARAQRHAIREAEAFDALVERVLMGGELLDDRDLPGLVAEHPDQQIGIVLAGFQELDLIGVYVGKDDAIRAVAAAAGIVDAIDAVAEPVGVGVGARLAEEKVVAGTHLERVLVGEAGDDVVARARLLRDELLLDFEAIPDRAVVEHHPVELPEAREIVVQEPIARRVANEEEGGAIDKIEIVTVTESL